MAFPCRKKLTQLLSAVCVSLCFIAVLRDMWLSDHGIQADSHVFRLRHFPSRLSFRERRGRKVVSAPIWPQEREPNPNPSVKGSGLYWERLHLVRKMDTLKNRDAIRMKTRRSQRENSEFSSTEALKNKLETRKKPQPNDYELPRHQLHNEKLQKRDIAMLTENLRDNLGKVPDVDIEIRPTETCNSSQEIGNSCGAGGCLQLKLPSLLDTRIEQIVQSDSLKVNAKYVAALSAMAAEIPKHSDIIVVSAVSSNHYLESQAMLFNLQQNLFPHLDNFTFVYYNLGLKPAERRYLSNICRCVMIDFPFHLFPEFLKMLKCYTWKPLIVNAVIQKSELVFWVDASIRFHSDPTNVLALLERSRERGIQMGWSKTTISKTTLPSMFHFFGDEACAYRPYNQGLSGVVIYHNEWLIKRTVLEPWAACALSDRCMCPQTGVDLFQARISCHQDSGKYVYGVCHRFDQSALSILLTKLYQENVNHVILKDINQFVDIKRGDVIVGPFEIQPEK
ncbi:hypothetical protein ElyMa_006465400 [Elysia marginata]|uniref:Hexosyltransferase n=1 Tax=Elysia marginata TaxID=1093978 RepID=A0AAV4I291_9GAST|nr:hypothetical protein ElyMa_006465400 [Elysia marginata]